MNEAETIVMQGPESDLLILSTQIHQARLSKFQAGTGEDIARLFLEKFPLSDPALWAIQGLALTEIARRVAVNLNITIQEATRLIYAMRSTMRKWHEDEDATYVIWHEGKVIFSSEMSADQRETIIKVLGESQKSDDEK